MTPLRWSATALAIALLVPSSALATGAAMMAGPVAIPRDLVSPDEPAERGRRAHASGVVVRTEDDYTQVKADLAGEGLTLGFVQRTGENFFVAFAAGSLLDATMDAGTGEVDQGASLLVEAAVTWRILEGYDEDPFVTTTLGFTHLRAQREDGLLASDLSLGLAVGKAFGERFAPYLAVKGFAGPHTWTFEGRDVSGHDVFRWSAAAGIVLATGGGWDVQAELAPVGAKAFQVAVGRWW